MKKIKLNTSEFTSIINELARLTDSKNYTYLTRLKLEYSDSTLRIKATNLALFGAGSLKAECPDDFSVTVNGADTAKLCNTLRDFELFIDGNRLVFKTKTGTYTLSAYGSDDFPSEPEWGKAKSIPANWSDIMDASRFASDDDMRPHLAGVWYDGDTVMATDGHAMFVRSSSDIEKRLFFPLHILRKLPDFIEFVGETEEYLVFNSEFCTYSATKPDLVMPPYQSVIPKDLPFFIVLTDPFVRAWERIGKFLRRDDGIDISITNKGTTLAPSIPPLETAIEENIAIKGTKASKSFNISLFSQALRSLNKIPTLHYDDQERSGIVIEDAKTRIVIMPLKKD